MNIVIIDSFALIHRVYHALPNFTTPAGEPSGAVYGFCSMFLKVLQKFVPDRVCAAFDDGTKPTFRKELAPTYHANRPEKDPDMVTQIGVIREFLDAMAVPVYAVPGFEGDDVIGSLAHQCSLRGAGTIVVTGDYDTLQLVDADTVVFTMRKGLTDTIVFDEQAVREKYGFAPALLPDYKALMGDPSDNYPGVPGIGPKSAQMLVQRFGSVERLYDVLEGRAPRQKGAALSASLEQKLRAGKDQAFLSKRLAVIRTDLALDVAPVFDASSVRVTDAARAFFERMGFASLLKRIDAPTDKTGAPRTARAKGAAKPLRLF